MIYKINIDKRTHVYTGPFINDVTWIVGIFQKVIQHDADNPKRAHVHTGPFINDVTWIVGRGCIPKGYST